MIVRWISHEKLLPLSLCVFHLFALPIDAMMLRVGNWGLLITKLSH
jgi:hypothetical protein